MKINKVLGMAACISLVAVMSTSCVVRLNKKSIMVQVRDKVKERPSGVIAEKDTVVSAFTALQVSGPIDVRFVESESAPSVRIKGSDNIIPYVKVEYNAVSSTLRISLKDAVAVIDDIDVTINAPAFTNLEMSGSSSFEGDVIGVAGEHSDIAIAGSANLDVKVITAGSLKMASAGSADIEIGRIAVKDQIFIALAGSGDIEADSVRGSRIETSIAGSGDVDLEGIDVNNMKASIAGSGTMLLSGNVVEDVFYSISGSGDINAENLSCPSVSTKTKGSGVIRYRDSGGRVVKVD